ncbi:hypothetical protein D3C72_1360070 [compost metagenome]
MSSPLGVGTSLPLSAPVFSWTTSRSTALPLRVSEITSRDAPSPSPFSAYPRTWTVLMIVAYVDGRPIPRSSSFFTRLPSVKRAGGRAKTWRALALASVIASPLLTGGRMSASFLLPPYTFRKPSKIITSPLASNALSLVLIVIVIVVFSSLAGAIWLARVRLRMRL